ncbi:DUF6193 family natural product biosynthesis protein [Kitasatospora sp. NPDC051853]|uniref:DUF6193 family natural product biosynthesis protein n=1 Tax=Kitasatospora sp. NPDC051853 TaxID=3364058 RepID=UPI0037A1104D
MRLQFLGCGPVSCSGWSGPGAGVCGAIGTSAGHGRCCGGQAEQAQLAEAHEHGDAVEAQWTSHRHTTARHVGHGLIKAAYARPQLRALFPFHSHQTLNFSRCTGFPYTHDVPVITPVHGKHRVTWWKTRSPHGPADIGETDNPRDAVALVLVHLPADCGPAVAGTANDLDLPIPTVTPAARPTPAPAARDTPSARCPSPPRSPTARRCR